MPLGSGRVGSDDLGYGPGSGFSFEPVQSSRGNPLLKCDGYENSLGGLSVSVYFRTEPTLSA